MIGAVREWLSAVVAVSLLLSVAQTLIPEGSLRKIASFTGGLILLVTLLRPLLGADLSRLDLRLEDYAEAIQERQAELESDGKTELAELIETRTAAYISDKADALGVSVAARVETRMEGGMPVPWTAELTGQRSGELAAYIEEELGIPRGRQIWHEVET